MSNFNKCRYLELLFVLTDINLTIVLLIAFMIKLNIYRE